MDQAGLVTLKPGEDGNESRVAFFTFLSEFSAADVDVRLVVSLRTEYYGRYRNEMHQAGVESRTIRDYYLAALGKAELIAAIKRPTSQSEFGARGSPQASPVSIRARAP